MSDALDLYLYNKKVVTARQTDAELRADYELLFDNV